MRMSARFTRAGRLALQLLPALLVVCGMVYLLQSTQAHRDARTVVADHHFNRGTETPAPATPSPAPTPVPSQRPTPEPTPSPQPPPLEPDEVYVYVPPPPPTVAPTPSTSRYRTDWAQSVLALISQARANAGLGPVVFDGALQSSADYYVELHTRIADVYVLNHYLDGGPGDRAWARGYCCAVGEILATAEESAQQVFDVWMASPPHAAVIMDGAYDHVGVACYQAPYTTADRGVIYPVTCAAEFGNSVP